MAHNSVDLKTHRQHQRFASSTDWPVIRRTQVDGMTISEIAEQLGTTVRALRYYEDLGLLNPARKKGGMRSYTLADRKEAERVVTLRMLGLSLHEIRVLQSTASDEDRLLAMTHTLRQRRERLVGALAHIDMLLQRSSETEDTDWTGSL